MQFYTACRGWRDVGNAALSGVGVPLADDVNKITPGLSTFAFKSSQIIINQ